MIRPRIPRASLRLCLQGRPASLPLSRYASSSSSSGPSPTSTAFLSVAFLAAAAGVYYYETRASSFSGYPETFSIRIRNKDYSYKRKSDAELETILTEHEDGSTIDRPGNPVFRWDRNWVGSNEPCEDRSAVDIVPRSSGVTDVKRDTPAGRAEGDRDIGLWSIMDGHAGSATSQLLSETLHPAITLALAALQASVLGGAKSWSPLSWFGAAHTWSPASVAETLSKAYTGLDDKICQTPIQMTSTVTGPSAPNATQPTPGQQFVALAAPAQAGACAISTVIDAEHNDLYVALTGDCRAVAGWQDADGKWRCDVLTEDQMGENPKEVQRMIGEHPASEKDTVIVRGRVQGGLQPTRAFGDAVYKWTRDQATRVNQIFHWEGKETRSQRPNHLTPPYVTAEPVVTHRPLSSGTEKLKFVIMATDGLWDRITSEEAALLVASYLAHPTHPDVPKQYLPAQIPFHPPPAERPYPVEALPGTKGRDEGSWCFEGDKNAATHLIRNSLGGGDRKERGELLSMDGKMTRWLRDDITVSVIFFDDPAKGAAAA